MRQKTFIPGSEWIYFKLYTGTKTADAILKNEIHSLVQNLIEKNIIDKWFFIRYSDPDFHIRLRLHFKQSRDFSSFFDVFFEIFQPIIDVGLVWNIQCETYQREMERYGHNTISIVEDLFFIDSLYIIKLLQQIDEEYSEQYRWKLSVVLIDSFLSCFAFEIEQRRDLLSEMADSFKKEFGFIHHNLTKQLNEKYRFNRKEIESVLLWKDGVIETINIVEDRRLAILTLAEKIINIRKSNELEVSIKSLMTSLIHMTMNRWFRTKNRLHEVVIYDFLTRYYANVIAKEKYRR